MIKSKQDKEYYISQDRLANIGNPSFLKYWFKRFYETEGMMAYLYLKSLREYEYALNCTEGISRKILVAVRKWQWHKLCIKYNISIGPNMVGPGFRMPHIVGGGIIINCKSMGANCSANTNVLVGNKDEADAVATIGDNVKLSTGCMVIGRIMIGDNVTVAPNAVVTKDVPADCVVGGVPAKILKYKEKE